MASIYDRSRATSARLLKKFAQGDILLTRETYAEGYDPDGPFPPDAGDIITTVYRLDATARGVSQKYVDGTTVLASDLQITAGPKAAVVSVDGVAADPDADPVSLTAQMSDTITVDGAEKSPKEKSPKRVTRIPAAGDPVTILIFVEG